MHPNEIRGKRILISVLNWGMGHVARSIGLVHQLIEQDNLIFIACSEHQKIIFEAYFNQVEYLEHADYPFVFEGKGNFAWDISKRLASLQKRMTDERKEVELMVNKYDIDLVLSDHRYGFRSRGVTSIFITHQFNLPLKWHQKTMQVLHKKLMRQFDLIWIMDDKNSRLAGKLSMSQSEQKAIYIGHYTRFSMYKDEQTEKKYSVLIASGPDIYAQQLIDQVVKEVDGESLIIICNPELRVPEKIERFSGTWKERDELIRQAKIIYSRSGYSTIMDVDYLKCEFKFYPTPGQAEQLYLANY